MGGVATVKRTTLPIGATVPAGTDCWITSPGVTVAVSARTISVAYPARSMMVMASWIGAPRLSGTVLNPGNPVDTITSTAVPGTAVPPGPGV